MKRALLIAIAGCAGKPVVTPSMTPPPPAPVTTWTFDPIGDRQPDTARYVSDDGYSIDRDLELIDLGGYREGVLTGIDVAYTAPPEEDPPEPHHVIWSVYADEGGAPADTPLATFEATIVPPNHIGDGKPVQWTHHAFDPPVQVHDHVWLTWESPGHIDVAFTSDSLASVEEQDGYITPEGDHVWRDLSGNVADTPFVRAEFTDVK